MFGMKVVSPVRGHIISNRVCLKSGSGALCRVKSSLVGWSWAGSGRVDGSRVVTTQMWCKMRACAVSVSLVTETGGRHLNLNTRFCWVLHSQLWVLLLQRKQAGGEQKVWQRSDGSVMRGRHCCSLQLGTECSRAGGKPSCPPAGLCWTLRPHAAQTFRASDYPECITLVLEWKQETMFTGWVQAGDVTGSLTSSLNRSEHSSSPDVWLLIFWQETITTLESHHKSLLLNDFR